MWNKYQCYYQINSIQYLAGIHINCNMYPIGLNIDRVRHALGMICNTAVFNATGHPALSINAGYDEEKLPVGLMIVGKHHDDQTVLRVAQAVETLANTN